MARSYHPGSTLLAAQRVAPIQPRDQRRQGAAVQFSHEPPLGGPVSTAALSHDGRKLGVRRIAVDQDCMSCTRRYGPTTPLLSHPRQLAEDKPIEWTRVHELPTSSSSTTASHVQKGIGCFDCHGNVAGMPLMWKAHSLHMEWCLDCHRAPEKYIRPRDQVFNMGPWSPGAGIDRLAAGRDLVKKYNVRTGMPADPHHEKLPKPITNCSACHY